MSDENLEYVIEAINFCDGYVAVGGNGFVCKHGKWATVREAREAHQDAFGDDKAPGRQQ